LSKPSMMKLSAIRRQERPKILSPQITKEKSMHVLLLAAMLFTAHPTLGHSASPNYEVPVSSVAVPSQCTGTYTHAFVAPAGSKVTGTSENDLIFVGEGSSALGGDGDDCIVGGVRSSLKGEAGNDTLVSNGQSSLNGGADVDTAYYKAGSDSVKEVENKIAY
jgi:hypothetical protein